MKIKKIVSCITLFLSTQLCSMQNDALINNLDDLRALLAEFQNVITHITRTPEENKIAKAVSDIEDLIDRARLAQAADKNAESIALYQNALAIAKQFVDSVAVNDLAIEIYNRQLPLIAQTSNLDGIMTIGTKLSDHVGLMANRVTRNENLARFGTLQKLINSLKTIDDARKKLTKDTALVLVARILVNGQAAVELMQNEQFSSFKPHYHALFKSVNSKLVGQFFDISNKAQKDKLAQLIEETK